MKRELATVEAKVAALDKKVRVLLYDSGEDKAFTAACCGSANLVVERAGGINLFNDLEGNYKSASWEVVVERDPEVIVLIEAGWSTSAEKEKLLLTNEALADITAVKNKRFVVVPFSSTSPGVRVPTLIDHPGEGILSGLVLAACTTYDDMLVSKRVIAKSADSPVSRPLQPVEERRRGSRLLLLLMLLLAGLALTITLGGDHWAGAD